MSRRELGFAPVWDDEANAYAEWVRKLEGRSGVYVLRSLSGEILYVGESHEGHLYGTMTRHFQRWERQHYNVYDKRGGRRGGNTYDRLDVEAGAILCAPRDAVQLQYDVIQQLNPRDNVVTGEGVYDGQADDDTPF